jgi:predicted GIY-YIG superfamily endonuclease
MEEDWVNYMQCELFRQLVDHNMCVLPFTDNSRYDEALHRALVHLLTTGTLHPSLHNQMLRTDTHLSMCLTDIKLGSRTRSRVNREEAARWIAASTEPIHVIGKRRWTRGMPVTACTNLKRQGILNSHKLVFVGANTLTVTLERNGKQYAVSHALFADERNFRYGFCDSVFRSQGYTLRTAHNVYDTASMSRQDLYTALSRFTTLADIGLDCIDWDLEYAWKTPPAEPIEHTLAPVSLKEAMIYRIRDANNNQYIGLTTGTLEKRYDEHQQDPTSQVMKQWLATCETWIELVCTVHYAEEHELLKIEARYIQSVPPEKSKNTQHKPKPANSEKASCEFFTQPPIAPRQRVQPKVSHDAKNKRYKIQQRIDGVNVTKQFSYGVRSPLTQVQALEQANAYSEL